MATVTSSPFVSNALVAGLIYSQRWNESALQYYFGNNTSLGLDAEFSADFQSFGYTGTPDTTFAFASGARQAFRSIDAVISYDFSESTTATNVEFVLVSSRNHAAEPNLEGFFGFPGSSTAPAGGFWSFGTISSDLSVMTTAAEVGGSAYSSWTLIHEIGHALGLVHSFAYSGIGLLDEERFSVMSYTPASSGIAYGHAVGPMALDIAALQALYGTESYATGDSTYTLYDPRATALRLTEGDVGIGRAYFSIWDSGGTDEIVFGSSGSATTSNSVLINLNAATLNQSSVQFDLQTLIDEVATTTFFSRLEATVREGIEEAGLHAGGFFSQVLTRSGSTYSAIDGGFSIANGASIENATGNVQADLLIGNAGANVLRGDRGDDTMLGGSGADTLDGGTVGPYATNSASVAVPSSTQTLSISLTTAGGTNDSNTNVRGLINLTGGVGANYNVAYVVDRSGSMSSSFAGNTTIPDYNSNGSSNELMDGAILAFSSLNQSIVNGGSGASDTAVIAFESSASTIYTGRADAGVEAALGTLLASGGTNFESGLQQAITFFQGAGAGTNRVYFVSDGENNSGGSFQDEVQTLIASSGINAEIRAIGLGTGADLTQLNQLDNTGGAEIALSPGQLSAGLLGGTAALSQIARVEILVNGTVRRTLSRFDLVSTPDGLAFATNVTNLFTTVSDTITARVVLNNTLATTASTSVTVANVTDDDLLHGGFDNDMYEFSEGFGRDIIVETGGFADQIILSSGLTDYALRPNQTNRNDLDIVVEDIDVITIRDYFLGGANIVESMTLGDGRQVNLSSGLTVEGSGSNDWLRGTDFSDVILAGRGDDTLIGGTGGGDDIYDGGAGTDTIDFRSSTVDMFVDLAALRDQAVGLETGTDQLFNIENVVGGNAVDSLSGNERANVLAGLDGRDILNGRDGNDAIFGGNQDDILVGGLGVDSLNGGNGLDQLFGDSQAIGGSGGLRFGPGAFTATAATGNTSLAQAVDLSNRFSLAADPDIANATTVPHVSISGTGNGASQFYRVTVGSAGVEFTLDVDYALNGSVSFDSFVRLYNEAGAIVASNDDSSTTLGAGGSSSSLDSFLVYTTAAPGTYYFEIGTLGDPAALPVGATYELQVSVSGAPLAGAPGGNDTLNGAAGNDTIDGGSGIDRALFSGASGAASWTRGATGAWTVVGADGTDTLSSTEVLDFADRQVALWKSSGQDLVGDFNGDGREDVLWRNQSGAVATWEIQANGSAAYRQLETTNYEWAVRGVGDFNGDGRDDILWRNETGATFVWAMNGSRIGASSPGAVSNAWDIVATGDFNGNGTDDILWRSTTGQLGGWLMGNGVRQSSISPGTVGAEWSVQGSGDFNGDGRDDILWRNANTGASAIWQFNAGAATVSRSPSFGARSDDWSVRGIGDFNGDGRDDILWRNASGQTQVWLMNGTTVLGQRTLGNASTAWEIQGVGDTNNDGRADIIWRNDTGQMSFWRTNAGATSITGVSGSTVGTEWTVM